MQFRIELCFFSYEKGPCISPGYNFSWLISGEMDRPITLLKNPSCFKAERAIHFREERRDRLDADKSPICTIVRLRVIKKIATWQFPILFFISPIFFYVRHF